MRIVRVVASAEVASFVGANGGCLYVWPARARCCGGVERLRTSTERPSSREFSPRGDDGGFELLMPSSLGRSPDELHLDLRRFPLRVAAYWDGCAWVT